MTQAKTAPKTQRRTRQARDYAVVLDDREVEEPIFSVDGHGQLQARPMPDDEAKRPSCQGDEGSPEEPAPATPHPRAVLLGKLRILAAELAEASERLAQGQYLDAGRVIDGVRICLEDSAKHRRLARAATDLAGKAGKLPTKTGELKSAAAEIVRYVRSALAQPNANCDSIAGMIEFARSAGEHLGTKRLLPHAGTAEERIALFAEVIRTKVIPYTDVGQPMDPEAIVKACFKACDGKGQPFRAEQKRIVRERAKRKARNQR